MNNTISNNVASAHGRAGHSDSAKTGETKKLLDKLKQGIVGACNSAADPSAGGGANMFSPDDQLVEMLKRLLAQAGNKGGCNSQSGQCRG